MKQFICAASIVAVLGFAAALPLVASAQVTPPSRGGTGTSTLPSFGQLLVGNSMGGYTLTATSSLGISSGSGIATTSIDTESELEAVLTDVINVFTNNDGALADDNLSNNTTTDLPEGSNLYYTLSRVQTALQGGYSAIFGSATTTNATSTHLAVTDSFNLLGSVITNVSTWFNGLFDARLATKTTTNLGEGANLYFTDARARSAVSETIPGIDYSSGTGVFSLASEYAIPLSASTTEWATAYSWGDHSTAGYENTLSFAYPLVRALDAVSLAFGTTTANTWNAHNSFTSLFATNASSTNATTTSFGINSETFTDLTGAGLQNIGGVLTLNATGDWTGTFDGQQGAHYLDRANHTGTQLAATISDFASAARTLLSSTATGLTYTSGTGVFSLTAGYVIPLTASTTEWATAFGWGNHASAGYESALTFTYPLQRAINTISLAFGTTTSNTWAGTQTFTNLITGSISGNAGTATSLAANGTNCSSGSAPLGVDASGASENCFDVWTEAENTAAAYAPQSRQLTISGTANQITSSAGAQTLAADRTWTLSLPSHVIFPSSFFAASGSTTNATTTNQHITGLVSQLLRTDANGRVSGTTIGSGLTFDGTTLSATGGSGGGLSTTSPWTAGQLAYVISNSVVSGVSTTTLSGNSQVAVSNSPVVLGTTPSALSIVADSIGDTQLAFNTGQNLTTASSPTFAGLTLSSALSIGNGGTGASSFQSGGVLFEASGAVSSDADFVYNATTNQLTAQEVLSPTGTSLQLAGDTNAQLDSVSGDINIRAAGDLFISNNSGSMRVALDTTLQTVDGPVISFPDTAGVPDTFCLQTLANCAGSGSPGGNSGELQFNDSGSFGGLTFSSWNPAGYLGIGSTTPWGVLSIASTTWSNGHYARPLLSVATSTDSWGTLFNVFATTTDGSVANPLSFVSNIISGVRLGVGTLTQYGFPGLLDHLFGNIRINTGDVAQYECYGGSVGSITISTDFASACGDWALQEDGTITGNSSGLGLGGVQGFRIQIVPTGGAASGGALTLTRDFSAATSSPIMEGALVRGTGSSINATSTVYFGFTNTSPSGSTFDTPPTAGCYFTASTTQNNWIATCHSGASTYAGFVNTGISTTTTDLTRFRIEMSNTRARFLTQSVGGNLTTVAEMSGGNYPAATLLTPMAMVAEDATGGTTSNLDINYLRLWSLMTLDL